jgi:hypothetical protein
MVRLAQMPSFCLRLLAAVRPAYRCGAFRLTHHARMGELDHRELEPAVGGAAFSEHATWVDAQG